jgi:hypothetical protein
MKIYSRHTISELPGFEKNRELFPFFFLESYAQYLDEAGHGEWLLFVSADGECMMPVRRYRSRFLRLVQILYVPLKKTGRLEEDQELGFLETFLDCVRTGNHADRIVQPPTHVVFRKAPLNTVSCGFGTWYLSLNELTEEELWKRLHGKHRNVIRNAQNQGVIIKEGADQLDIFFELYRATMQRSDMYVDPVSEFRQLYSALKPDHIVCAVAYFQGKPQGGILLPYTHFGAYYVYGASADRMEVNGAVNYLHWTMILLMKKRNVARYDFVGTRLTTIKGSRLEGIQQFKVRFGSELEKGCLWKTDVNRFKCRLYDRLLELYWKLKRMSWKGDIIDQEISRLTNFASVK